MLIPISGVAVRSIPVEIDQAGGGDIELIAASIIGTEKKIVVMSWALSSRVSVLAFKFKSSGGGSETGTFSVEVGIPHIAPSSTGWFACDPGEGLVLNIATQQDVKLGGVLTYALAHKSL